MGVKELMEMDFSACDMFTDAMRVCIDQRELFGKPYAKKITERPWVNLNVIMLLPHFIKLADQKVRPRLRSLFLPG